MAFAGSRGGTVAITNRTKIALFLFSVLLFLAAHGLARLSPETYRELNIGDTGGGLLERIQAVLYFAALVLGLVAAFQAYRSPAFWPLVLFSLGAFFVFGEEVAWGQFLFGAEVPEFFLIHNQQGDMTLHNLYLFEDRYLHYWAFFAVGLYGSLAWLAAPYLPRHLLVLVPPWCLSLYFMICMAYYGHKLIPNFPFPHLLAKQETAETALAIGVFFMAVLNLLACYDRGQSIQATALAANDLPRPSEEPLAASSVAAAQSDS
jgi:hypothetical protein